MGESHSGLMPKAARIGQLEHFLQSAEVTVFCGGPGPFLWWLYAKAALAVAYSVVDPDRSVGRVT